MFSIIITCYNEGVELRRAVDSVRKQTYTDYEIIVVKDFSAHEETLRVCKELEQEGVRVLYADSNVGVSVTRNMGITTAKGEYIYTVDGDDELPTDALLHIAHTFENNPDADVIYGDYELIENEIQETISFKGKSISMANLYSSKLYGQLPMCRTVVNQLNGFSERYSFGCQDFELQVRLLKYGAKFVYTPHTIYRWYKKPTGINSSKRNAESLDMCMYEHRDFVASYIGHRYLLQLCKQNNDADSYRKYFAQYAPNWCKWARILPFRLMTKFERFVKS